MKKILSIILSLILFISFTHTVNAAAQKTTPTVAPTEKDEKLNTQINQLKEKIASRVAELNLVEKRGVIGVVTEVSAHQITLTDVSGKNRMIDVDEITKFSSASNKNFGLSDLTKGTKISVLGLYNKQSKRILARFISIATIPNFFSGTISEIDKKNFIITVVTEDQKQTKVDIQTSTKILTQEQDAGLIKYGFSKLAVGNRVFVVGTPNKKDPSLFVATRFITLPQLPSNPNVVISQPETVAATEAITPATGKKVSPTTTR